MFLSRKNITIPDFIRTRDIKGEKYLRSKEKGCT